MSDANVERALLALRDAALLEQLATDLKTYARAIRRGSDISGDEIHLANLSRRVVRDISERI